MNLVELGWNDYFAALYNEVAKEDNFPGRISREAANSYAAFTESGEFEVEITGRFRHHAEEFGGYPTAGDWVVLKHSEEEGKANLIYVLPRKSYFSRKAVLGGGPAYGEGRTQEQAMAANVDTVFLVNGLDGDCNARRIERYLTIAWNSGASPVVVLNKADASADPGRDLEEIESVALGVPVHLTSALTSEGVDLLRQYTSTGKTIAFLGSSGVGKSTLINSLLGSETLKTGAVREIDKRGKHTTTHRELVLLEGGGVLIDTPGMRTIRPWGNEDGLSQTFSDVEELIQQCRFSNCGHKSEPGCAIQEAIDSGTLDEKRFRNYQKLSRELVIMAVRKEQRARMDVFGKRMKKYQSRKRKKVN